MRIAAADIGGTDIKYALADGDGPLCLNKSPTPGGGGAAIVRHVGNLIETLGAFDAVAVCTAGQVDPEKGEIIYANENIPGYTGTRVKAQLEGRFQKPALVLNDVNAAALGEGAMGAARGFSDYLCLTYGTGIGGAIVIGGRLYEGATHSAGEFGHIVTHKGGAHCACGGRGCYERYASTAALTREAGRRLGEPLDGYELFNRLNEGKVRRVVDGWIEEILTGIASLCHVFNPACVVVGGGIMDQQYLFTRLQVRFPRHIMQSFAAAQLKRAELGNAAGMYGAVTTLQRTLMSDGYAG
jgi:predicted NBD/HSP70 family sugar kinase